MRNLFVITDELGTFGADDDRLWLLAWIKGAPCCDSRIWHAAIDQADLEKSWKTENRVQFCLALFFVSRCLLCCSVSLSSSPDMIGFVRHN